MNYSTISRFNIDKNIVNKYKSLLHLKDILNMLKSGQIMNLLIDLWNEWFLQ